MDRSTRIALVVSVVWIGIAYMIADERSGGYGTTLQDTLVLGLAPVLIYWAYRFIRAGRPRKISQTE